MLQTAFTKMLMNSIFSQRQHNESKAPGGLYLCRPIPKSSSNDHIFHRPLFQRGLSHNQAEVPQIDNLPSSPSSNLETMKN